MAILKPEMQALVNKDSSRFASLYVGDLSPEVTEEDLSYKFSLTVPVLSAHLCRNSVTGKSMCYAYVNFDSPLSASNAMACLNHTDMKGKTMRIMWAQKDLAYRRSSGIGNLFVKNLDSSITSICLERIFSPFGAILSCKVAQENGQSKGFGFVQFDTEQSAVAARSALHGSMVDGKKLFVAKFINKNERAAMSGNQDFTNVYVKNLNESVTEDILHRLFSQYGTVSSVVVMRDGMGRSRGFGFVDFCHPDYAKKAMESLNGRLLGSMKLYVGRALKKAERMEVLKQKHRDNFIDSNMECSNLYVKNLSESVDEARLREIFGSYGQIVSAKVMRHENGKTKGFGFVCFSNREESKQAKSKLNGFLVDGKPIFVRVAERKEDRLKRMQRYFQVQPRHYPQAPPVPLPAQPVLPPMPSSYGYMQPIHMGTSYYYLGTQLPHMLGTQAPEMIGTQAPHMLGTQLPQMLGHQNTTTNVPASQANLKEKRSSVQLFYNQPVVYTYGKSGAKQKLVFMGHGNQNVEAATCSKATTSEEELRRATSNLKALLTPNAKAEKSGKIRVAKSFASVA
ncbi:hypothetical protein AALP_AA3G185400 [Arabis alpina]|uniref:RRM domain-containing protein n=1 Tax=Arabis alpina TaxID=50452 RepID=A0A087HA36_ARAAL|nr:hypothetical protein AALP_AA3G185400 [Arabis alpina]